MDADWNVQRDRLLHEWMMAKDQLSLIKDREMELRKQVQQMLFPDPKKGTQRYELGNGYKIKLVHKINYKLGDKDKIDPETGNKIPVVAQVEDIMAAIEKCGNEGSFIVDRLIKTQYDLSISEYEKLDNTSPIKNLVDSILITSDAAPSLELEFPVEK